MNTLPAGPPAGLRARLPESQRARPAELHRAPSLSAVCLRWLHLRALRRGPGRFAVDLWKRVAESGLETELTLSTKPPPARLLSRCQEACQPASLRRASERALSQPKTKHADERRGGRGRQVQQQETSSSQQPATRTAQLAARRRATSK